MYKKIITESAEETMRIGAEFAKTLAPLDIVCLYGDLGAGKTTFTQGIAKGLGITSRIMSPTFALVRHHDVNHQSSIINHKSILSLYHIDLYRLESLEEVKSIGIDEMVHDPHAITLIEWAEKMGDLLPKKRIEVHIQHGENDTREITIQTL